MMTNDTKAFELKNVTKRFKKRQAVTDLSFSGSAGEIVGFLGPNGAGKTTTIKMMTGLSPVTSGEITIFGHDIKKEYEAASAFIGAIVETPVMYDYMTGRENLKLFAGVKGCGEGEILEAEKLTELGDRLNDRVSGYSLGMKQRLGIAVALLGSPKLLILDEPTNGLDPLAIRNMRNFLKRLSHEEGTCVLISSHMLWEMEKMCDRVIIVNEGICLGEADIGALREQGINLEDYYVSCVEKKEERR